MSVAERVYFFGLPRHVHKASRLRETKGQTQDLREPHSSQGDQGSSPGSRERRTSRPTMNPHVVSMDAADFTVMFVFLALQMFVFKLRVDWIWLAWASDRKSTVSKQNQTHTEYAVGKQNKPARAEPAKTFSGWRAEVVF